MLAAEPKTHPASRRLSAHPRWRAFDRAVADRILLRVTRGEPLRRVLASGADFPCLAVVERWRRERPEFEAELKMAMIVSRYVRGARRLWSEALQHDMAMRILEGRSLRAVAADPAMPCGATIRNWIRRKPDFARSIGIACEMRDQMLGERMLEMAFAATPGTAAADGRTIGVLRFRAGGMRRGRGRA